MIWNDDEWEKKKGRWTAKSTTTTWIMKWNVMKEHDAVIHTYSMSNESLNSTRRKKKGQQVPG